jgi:N,N'-diacetyllegionaminate synthase
MNKIIAEIGSVHDGDINKALALVKRASSSGADIIKFQMHIAEEETLHDAPSPSYFKKEKRFDYFKRTAFTLKDWTKIKKLCEKLGNEFLCSPFSEKAVDYLESLKVKEYKVPSGELTNISLLEKLKKTKKHIILSTGMSSWNEIDVAVNILKNNYSILQCSSIYPCPLEKVGINIIHELKKRYKCPVGFSDHTLGYAAAFAAASNGASIIEKHFTLSRKMYGSDAKNSMEPKEFLFMVKNIKEIWKIIDHPIDKNDLREYQDMKKIFEKSVVASRNLKAKSFLKKKDIVFKKPGTGIRALYYKSLIGKKLNRNINKDSLLEKKYFYEN